MSYSVSSHGIETLALTIDSSTPSLISQASAAPPTMFWQLLLSSRQELSLKGNPKILKCQNAAFWQPIEPFECQPIQSNGE